MLDAILCRRLLDAGDSSSPSVPFLMLSQGRFGPHPWSMTERSLPMGQLVPLQLQWDEQQVAKPDPVFCSPV